jgi:transcriptional regulator with GAF, ATPase, and Fis domain
LAEHIVATSERSNAGTFSVPVTLEEADRSHILQALEQTGGVIGGPQGAAVLLGLPRTTLISKMRRLGISPVLQLAPARVLFSVA